MEALVIAASALIQLSPATQNCPLQALQPNVSFKNDSNFTDLFKMDVSIALDGARAATLWGNSARFNELVQHFQMSPDNVLEFFPMASMSSKFLSVQLEFK